MLGHPLFPPHGAQARFFQKVLYWNNAPRTHPARNWWLAQCLRVASDSHPPQGSNEKMTLDIEKCPLREENILLEAGHGPLPLSQWDRGRGSRIAFTPHQGSWGSCVNMLWHFQLCGVPLLGLLQYFCFVLFSSISYIPSHIPSNFFHSEKKAKDTLMMALWFSVH